jgi:2-succinyl-6-hydroxy-2,4-cyclohexadiene-1-carboxylate synthase
MKVFYLHGMGGSPADWKRVAQLVPGEGLHFPVDLSFSETAAELSEPLEKLQEPFLLCGYSLGGRIALQMTERLRNPQLKGLLLLGTGLGFSDESSRRERQLQDQRWSALARADLARFWDEWYQQDLFSTFSGLPEELRKAWLEERFSMEINPLCHQLEALSPARHDDLWPRLLGLPRARISVLYLAGERDKRYANLAKQLKERGIPAEIVPGAGHILPLEAPEAVAEGLRRLQGKKGPGILERT